MASVRKKGTAYYCTFRFQGRRYYFTVGDMSETKAKGVEVEEILALIERGRLVVPEGVSLEDAVHPHGPPHAEIGRSAPGMVDGTSGKPVSVLSVPARDAKQDQARRTNGGHQGRDPRSLQANVSRIKVASAARLPCPAA